MVGIDQDLEGPCIPWAFWTNKGQDEDAGQNRVVTWSPVTRRRGPRDRILRAGHDPAADSYTRELLAASRAELSAS